MIFKPGTHGEPEPRIPDYEAAREILRRLTQGETAVQRDIRQWAEKHVAKERKDDE